MQSRTISLLAGAAVVCFVLPAHAQNSVFVTTTIDVVDPGDGVVSLREAFDVANGDADATLIVLARGATYELTLCGAALAEDANVDGDLDHTAPDPLAIDGRGATIRNTCPEERIIESVAMDTPLDLDALTLTGGNVTDFDEPGGAVRSFGPLTVTRSLIRGNAAVRGAGLFGGDKFSGGQGADITVLASSIVDNTGTAINAGDFSASILVEDSTIARNTGAGMTLSFGPATVRRTLIQDNGGSGIALVDGTPLVIVDSTLRRNGGFGAVTTGQGHTVLRVTRALVEDNGDAGLNCSFCGTVQVTDTTIRNNTARSARGGGLRVTVGASVERQHIDLLRVKISGNTAPDGGGGFAEIQGIDVDDETPLPIITVVDSTIRSNSTGPAGDGGGMHVESGDLEVRRSGIHDNRASAELDGTGADGGGIFFEGEGALSLIGSSLNDNIADGSGGGIRAVADLLTLERTQLNRNHAAFGGGGGISAAGGEVAIVESSLRDNRADLAGGGIAHLDEFARSGNLLVQRSTLAGNVSDLLGGGGAFVRLHGSVTRFENSTVHGNRALIGGGVQTILDGDLELVFSTVTQNASLENGANVAVAVGELTSFASAVGEPSGGPNCSGGTSTSEGFNVGTDASCGFGPGPGDRVVGSLGLGPLAMNGGPTATRLPLAGSPLLATVPAAACLLDTDQRLVPRPQGARCETGAVEVRLGPKAKPCHKRR